MIARTRDIAFINVMCILHIEARGGLTPQGIDSRRRCNRLRCPLARMSGLQCFNMGHNGHGINLYGVSMTLMGN